MRDFVVWEPGVPLVCIICGIERGGADPPGPWFRHRPSHRRRIPIFGTQAWAGSVPLGYFEYIYS